MADVIFVALTIAAFVILGLVVPPAVRACALGPVHGGRGGTTSQASHACPRP